jgi:hypothetical protein
MALPDGNGGSKVFAYSSIVIGFLNPPQVGAWNG